MTGRIADRVVRRARSAGGRLVRRLGLLPAGVPDGLGEDPRLTHARLDAEVVVYYPDTSDSLYQLEQWSPALRRLHRAHPTVILVRDSRVASRVRRDSGLPVEVVVAGPTLEGLLSRSDVRVALYVNHSPLNFHLLHFASLAHVSLLHGDSDKTISVSNQTKAYDFAFVAGRAAVDRVRENLSLYDESRLFVVGRPAVDAEALERRESGDAQGFPVRHEGVPGGVPTVLYAPTWEGAQVTAAYGSVASHGEDIVRSLLAGGYRIIYRPHPLTGVRNPRFGDADRKIRDLISHALRRDPAMAHRVDVDVPLFESFAGAALLICDVSAVAVEWLPTGRPLIITVPAEPQVAAADTALATVAPRLTAAGVAGLGVMVRRELDQDPTRDRRLALVEYYVGDTAPGAATAAFLAAVNEVNARRDVEWARVVGNGGRKP